MGFNRNMSEDESSTLESIIQPMVKDKDLVDLLHCTIDSTVGDSLPEQAMAREPIGLVNSYVPCRYHTIPRAVE